jgi:BolA-like protein 1
MLGVYKALPRFLNITSTRRSMSSKPVQTAITKKLTEALNPSFLEVVNESYKHNVPEGSESHFKVCVVSTEFEGKSPIQRHRVVNTLLKKELEAGLHALSIQAKTPAQWQSSPEVANTPNCMGGSKA